MRDTIWRSSTGFRYAGCALLGCLALSTTTASADQPGAMSPEASRARITVPEGIRVELVAAEPDVFDPVAMCFDEKGTLYVVENRGYPTGDPDHPAGTVVTLRDTDGDGRFEDRQIFADGFDYPNGILPWKGGVLVTAAPDVYFLRDTDGDGKADVREVFMEGFKRGGSTQLYVSHPTLGIDNWLHFTNGLSGGTVGVPDHPEIAPVEMGSNDLRYNPLTHALETRAGRGQFGLTFDDFGHKFTCSNRNHLVHSVLESSDLTRNKYLNASAVVEDVPEHGAASPIFALSSATTTAYAHEGTFTAACGLTIYRGTALPGEYYGNAFVCEPTGNLVHRDVLSPRGGTFEARRGETELASEFLASTDEWTRPVFLTNGPDGALYVCDMYRKTIEHPTYLPDEVAAITDFDAGKDRGRIYRITAKEYEAVAFNATTPDDLIDALGDDEGWHRDTAQRLLLQRLDSETVEKLETASHESDSVHTRVRGVNLLRSADALTSTQVLRALNDASPEVREQGLRLARVLEELPSALTDRVIALADDPSSHVRFAVALALGDIDTTSEAMLGALDTILRRDVNDQWTHVAVLSAVDTSALRFANRVLTSGVDASAGWLDLMEGLSRIVALSSPPEETARYIAGVLAGPREIENLWRLASLNGVYDGTRGDAAISDEALGPWLEWCADIVAETGFGTEARHLAVSVLGHTDYATAGDTLSRLLNPRTPQPLQVKVVEALNGFRDARVVDVYLRREVWLGFTTEARTAAINGILAHEQGVERIIEALETESIEAWTIDARNRGRLTGAKDEALRVRAAQVFADIKASDPGKRFEEYRDVLGMTPNATNGREVFQNVCMGCHRYGDIGHDVGPDLTGIRSQSLESILLHIINPNSLMVSGYESFYLETNSGDVYIGLIASETDTSVTLKQGLGIESTILREDIAILESNSLSMMPEELEAGMTRQELRDLLGFLKGE